MLKDILKEEKNYIHATCDIREDSAIVIADLVESQA